MLYRKILNDLSSDAPAVPRIEEEKSEDDSAPAITTVTMPTPIYQTSSGQYSKCPGIFSPAPLGPVFSRRRVAAVAITQGGAIQLANNGTDGVQGLQTLTMANTAAAQPGATILQYAQTSDGQQILVPSNQVVVQGGNDSSCPPPPGSPGVQIFTCAPLPSTAASGDVQAYQIRTAATSAITPGVVMATSPALGAGGVTEEVTRKREVRLMKNRWVRTCAR